MALSRSMKQYMQAPPGTDPRRAEMKVQPVPGTFGQAQSEIRRRQQPLSARNREKGQAYGRNPTGPIEPPKRPMQTGTAADRARASGMLTGGTRAPPKPRPSAVSGVVGTTPGTPQKGVLSRIASNAASQNQQSSVLGRMASAAGGGAKTRPPAGAFGFLGQPTQRPGFEGVGDPGSGRRGGSRQYLR